MLIPSIDLQNGRVVQLVQGEQLAVTSDDVDGWIDRFSRFSMTQVIDLDAAAGTGSNRDLVRHICRRLPCQVGGGVRTAEGAIAALAAGARRVIVGSALYTHTGVDEAAALEFSRAIGPDRLIAAVDGRAGRVAVHGWKTTLELPVAEAMALLEPFVTAFLATFIDGEGRLGGLDVHSATRLRQVTGRQLIVAGGIRDRSEVDRLHALGMDAVVGMAIYTGLVAIDEIDE